MNIGEEPSICLLTLIGIPGCGKTTFSSFLTQCLNNSTILVPFNCLVKVCYDEILNTHDSVQWNSARKLVLASVNEMIEKLKVKGDPELIGKSYKFNTTVCTKKFLETPKILIVIDDNMYYRSMRYRYYQVARYHTLSYCQILLKCDVVECIRRNSMRNPEAFVPERTILKMAHNMEEPNAFTNLWETFSISVNSNQLFDLSLASICKIIYDAFAQPVNSSSEIGKEFSQIVTSTSFSHQLDILLRRIIGNVIQKEKQALSKSQIKDLSSCLISHKQIILQQVKSGQLFISEEIIKGFTEADPNATCALNNLLQEHLTQSINETKL